MSAPLASSSPHDLRKRLLKLGDTPATTPEVASIRLALLRAAMPNAVVQIDTVRTDDVAIAIKATIALPSGARHSAIAAEDADSTNSWANQLALVEALAITRALDGLGITIHAALGTTSAPHRKETLVTASTTATDDHLSEYSWNSFWQMMNARNISKQRIEQALGKTVQESTPKEAMDAVRAAGILD